MEGECENYQDILATLNLNMVSGGAGFCELLREAEETSDRRSLMWELSGLPCGGFWSTFWSFLVYLVEHIPPFRLEPRFLS